MSQRKRIFIIMTVLLLLLTACSFGGQVMDGEGDVSVKLWAEWSE